MGQDSRDKPARTAALLARSRRTAAVVSVLACVLAAPLPGCQYQSIRRAQLVHRDAAPEVARAELASLAPGAGGFSGPDAILG